VSLMQPYVTPWVRDWLRAHPDEAMAVESLRLNTTCVEGGALSLFGKSAHGPFSAIVHTPDGPSDGYRGGGTTVLLAVQSALGKARAAA
jgi:hypothetical protein